MKSPLYINIVVEDFLTEIVIKKILSKYENKFLINNIFGKSGFGYIKSRIINFNIAAKTVPFLVIADLDQYECPPALIKEWLPYEKNPNLIFRVAVKEIETWLIADRENFSRFLRIPVKLISKEVESIKDPKCFIIKLAKKSPKKDIRISIIPNSGSTAKIGPNYNDCLSDFIRNGWEVDSASKNSISLSQALKSFDNFNFTIQ